MFSNYKFITIVVTIDNTYIQHCAVMLYSLFRHNPKQQFNIFILSEGLASTQKNKLQSYTTSFQQRIEFIDIDTRRIKNAPISSHISPATYYRLLIPSVLPLSISKVLFLDADIIIKSDVRKLWNLYDEKYSIIAAPDPNDYGRREELNIPVNSPYFNAGILLINLNKWRKENTAERIIEYINQNHQKLKYWDQDALNACLFNDVKILPRRWNATENYFKLPPEKLNISKEEHTLIVNHPAIIHFTSPRKPWHLENRHPLREEYRSYLKQTPWKSYSYTNNFIKRYTNKIIKNLKKYYKLI